MATTSKGMDRRIQRTQQLLKQAFLEIIREKGFTAMSIQDITDRANVNRGTFYAHFTDKYAILETIVREQFQCALVDTLPPLAQWDRSTLHLLIKTVLEYFGSRNRQCHPTEIMAPLFERAIHEELAGLLLEWLKQSAGKRQKIPLETTAQIMSWAIFGAATRWCQPSTTISSDQMAQDVLLIIMEGVEQLLPSVQDVEQTGKSSITAFSSRREK